VILGPHRSESKTSAPRYSPGLVQSDELVLRTILDPDHLEAGGQLKLAAISLEDIQFRGWSVDRKKFTSLRQLKIFHQDWKNRKPQIDRFYVLPVSANAIRLNPDGGYQEFLVTDAALCFKPGHAAVFAAKAGPQPPSKSRLRQLRNELLEKLPPYVDAGQVFEPLEKFGYVWGMFRQSAVFLASLRRFRGWRCLFFSAR
jgi:hypothetical protein